MAEENKKRAAPKVDPNDEFASTPGARSAAARGVEEPLRVGTRDALVEDGHNDGDYVPDIESKGYHVGQVRQPVHAVPGGFVSEHESKFAAQPTLADLKAKHNEDEASSEWNEGVQAATPTLSDRELAANGVNVAGRGGRRYGGRDAAPASTPADNGGEKLTGDALEEAGKSLNIEGWSGMTADEKREAVARGRGGQ